MTKADRSLEKQRRASSHPDRPGARCSAPAGTWTPVVDMTRCEGETDCVQVCPNDVFEVRRIDEEDYRSLGRMNRLRVLAHGKKMAYAAGDRCRACGMCVVACPQDAITLLPPG